jgi:hypothetical protein
MALAPKGFDDWTAGLDAADSIATTDLFPVVQGGVSKKATTGGGMALRITGYDIKQQQLSIVAGVVTVPLDGKEYWVDCTAAVSQISFVAAAAGYVGSAKVAFHYNATAGSVTVTTPTAVATPNGIIQNFSTALGAIYLLEASTVPGPSSQLWISALPLLVPAS